MKTILLVDDEQALVLALNFLLSGEGYRVVSAFNGEEALIVAQQERPDLILLDIMMPGMGGLETLEALRMHPDFQMIPVILMSGARPLASQSKYEWSEFIAKPFGSDELLALTKKYI